MSRRHDVHDASGIIADELPYGILIVRSKTTPTASAKGYSPGCLWINSTGTAGTVLYVNQGTFASATWLNLA